jgi:hypothetical protein
MAGHLISALLHALATGTLITMRNRIDSLDPTVLRCKQLSSAGDVESNWAA